MIQTSKRRCLVFEGVDLIRAREEKSIYQRDFAAKCYLSVHKYRQFEDGKFIVIPLGYKAIEEAEFDIMQDALL